MRGLQKFSLNCIAIFSFLQCLSASYEYPDVINNLHYGSFAPYDRSRYSSQNELSVLGNLLQHLAGESNKEETSSANLYVPPMAGSARMIGYGFPSHSSGYDMGMLGYGQQQQKGYQQQQPSYQPAQSSYQQPQPSYHQQMSYKPVQTGYGMTQAQGYGMDHGQGYGMIESKGYEKPKKEKVYVPIVIKKKKKKKRKTIAIYKGFYIEGGTQIFGKFKKMKDCQKACEITPNCYAADYNPWLKKCYIHTNLTACEEMRTHPKLVHFKKVPCDVVETPRGLITLGTQIFGGLEQKGIKSLQDCIKKCATAGAGIAENQMMENIARQICFGIDYDFGTHKCYFHTNMALCPDNEPIIPTPVQLVAAPSVINIILCPISEVA